MGSAAEGADTESAHLEGAEHGQEALPDDKGEQEVDRHGQPLPRAARLQRLDLARQQPPLHTATVS